MHAQLEAIVSDFRSAGTRVHALDRRLSPEAWLRRPSAESWSAAECVAHLNLTAEAMLPRFRTGLEEARRLGQPAPNVYRRDFVGWLIWKSLKPGGRMKTKTVASFVPTGDRAPREILADFDRLQADLIAVTRQSEGLPLHRVKMPSPFNERARYNLYSALTITAIHEHRHLLQAERVVS
ncbi:MAG TPA: DinB family protein [Vicinamibacterales bacterium]|nr:DinB family protein [Vicinamibacterales bacterium]